MPAVRRSFQGPRASRTSEGRGSCGVAVTRLCDRGHPSGAALESDRSWPPAPLLVWTCRSGARVRSGGVVSVPGPGGRVRTPGPLRALPIVIKRRVQRLAAAPVTPLPPPSPFRARHARRAARTTVRSACRAGISGGRPTPPAGHTWRSWPSATVCAVCGVGGPVPMPAASGCARSPLRGRGLRASRWSAVTVRGVSGGPGTG